MGTDVARERAVTTGERETTLRAVDEKPRVCAGEEEGGNTAGVLIHKVA